MTDDLVGFEEFGAGSRPRKRRGPKAKVVPFMDLPRPERRSRAVALRWRLRSSPDGAGVFLSHQLLPRTPSALAAGMPADAVSHWADFFFMSARPIREGVLYNAFAETLASAIVNAYSSAADDAADALLSPEEQELNRPRMFFGPAERSGCREMRFAKRPTFAAFGNKTEHGFKAEWMRANLPRIQEICPLAPRAELDHSYAFGIGVHFRTAEASIDGQSIPRLIADFLQRGEVAYEDECVDLEPHRAAIESMVLYKAASYQRMDARERGIKAVDPVSLDEIGGAAGAAHIGWESVPIKL